MYQLVVSDTISASHTVKDCGECSTLHGHSWKIEVGLSGGELIKGMLVDVKKVKDVIRRFDHKHLNKVWKGCPIAEDYATAEVFAQNLYDDIDSMLVENKLQVKVDYVSVSESEGMVVTYVLEEE